MSKVLSTFHVTLTPKVKVKGQILNLLENASQSKPFDVATSNFVAE